jgi:hypothetical protein
MRPAVGPPGREVTYKASFERLKDIPRRFLGMPGTTRRAPVKCAQWKDDNKDRGDLFMRWARS